MSFPALMSAAVAWLLLGCAPASSGLAAGRFLGGVGWADWAIRESVFRSLSGFGRCLLRLRAVWLMRFM